MPPVATHEPQFHTYCSPHGHQHTHTNGHSMKAKKALNGEAAISFAPDARPNPQMTCSETVIASDSFYGRLRAIYSDKVLKTQLEQLRKQGSYEAFKLQWHPAYDVRRLEGARTRSDGIPPSLFWESDVGKWIEGACYFLASPDGKASQHAAEYEASIQELVDMIEKAQQPDGYLDIYFIVVDPEGRYMNLRDMHEMYNAGHLLEAALAHHHYTGSRQFLNVMIRYIECFMRTFGPDAGQLHGYPGHPELELAVLRLYRVTKDPKHLAWGNYLLAARGSQQHDHDDKPYFIWEAEERRKDLVVPSTMDSIRDTWYHQAHLPLHDQEDILGHSVRAFYLTTAAADLGGEFLDDAKRLWADAVEHKMYVTGGFGTEPRFEGFSAIPYRLPQSTDEGGCYAETCAAIACMMTSERILSHALDGRVRDVLELCLLNAVLGGGSLQGDAFSYANKLATYGEEVATRAEWFEVCCCPPNLSRTLGMLGGYTWSAEVREKTIHLDVYLFLSASRTISLPDGQSAQVDMKSAMPWSSKTDIRVTAPAGYTWKLRLPCPSYASNYSTSVEAASDIPGFASISLDAQSSVSITFDMPVRLLSSNPKTGQDLLTVTRGPIVYTAESFDNPEIDGQYPHFAGIGLSEQETFQEVPTTIEDVPVVLLKASGPAYALREINSAEPYAVVGSQPARNWEKLSRGLVFVPWFARANRGGAGRVRTSFPRIGKELLK